MSKRGNWGPMSERVRQGASETPSTPELPAEVKHCWITDENGRLPGLLLEWRRIGDQYDGRVERLVREEGAWIVVEEWLPQTMLERA